MQNEIYKGKTNFPPLCVGQCFCVAGVDPHGSTSQLNMELLVAWLWHRQDSHKLQLNSCSCGNTSRGPHLTTLHGHPVHVGCLEGAIGRNKTTPVQFSMLRTDNFCLSRFDIIATPSSIMTCFSTGYSICRTVYFGKDCWLVQLPKFRPRDPDPTLDIEFCQWKLASSPQTTLHRRKTLLLRIHL